ncbi:MAG TPA: type II toxin-antitoxin system VapC family toxin [Planctomycetota bacterium]|nr:type II toxin-antitoxin system VapC family toxin [Planctomycetota bacterium]HRR79799.1 type II toxin-antitoxin system VapC family toxin [Planctomycetota bacterium]HRT94172.1 type II toxin-antitoxin system VapC family toxin [Planctomycetota bacterium]
MKTRVYVETSVLSYLTARPSRDLLIAAHQQVTHEWWAVAHERFAVCTADLVAQEARKGDPEAAAQRLELIKGVLLLDLTEDVRTLADLYQRRTELPSDARVDLMHVALPVVHAIDYLVTWNCAHIANEKVIRRIAEVNREEDRFMPLIVTPEAFLQIMRRRNPMARDPIVEEVHQIRRQMLAECRGDFDKLFDRLMAAQTRRKGRLLPKPLRRKRRAVEAK